MKKLLLIIAGLLIYSCNDNTASNKAIEYILCKTNHSQKYPSAFFENLSNEGFNEGFKASVKNGFRYSYSPNELILFYDNEEVAIYEFTKESESGHRYYKNIEMEVADTIFAQVNTIKYHPILKDIQSSYIHIFNDATSYSSTRIIDGTCQSII